MSSISRISLVLAGLVVTVAAGPSQDAIGSWVLTCADQGCTLRHKDRFFSKAGISADLEVRAAGRDLVPVLALRGIPGEVLAASSLAGRTEAAVRFAGGPAFDLACGTGGGGYLCAPKPESAAAMAAAFPGAKSVALRVTVTVQGMNPLPAQERSFDLSGTREALARLRAAGAAQVPAQVQGLPSGWVRLLDKGLRAAGYGGGVNDLPTVVREYLKR